MGVSSLSVSLVIEPVTFVNITISVNESSSAIGHIILPISFIDRSIIPDLLASSVSKTVSPLANIDSGVLEFIRTQVGKVSISMIVIIIDEVTDFLSSGKGVGIAVVGDLADESSERSRRSVLRRVDISVLNVIGSASQLFTDLMAFIVGLNPDGSAIKRGRFNFMTTALFIDFKLASIASIVFATTVTHL